MIEPRTETKSNRKLDRTCNAERREITLQEISDHCYLNDCWIVICDRVYDITEFLNQHPAGSEILMEHAGCDASLAFLSSGHSNTAVKMLSKYLIGILPREERLFPNTNI